MKNKTKVSQIKKVEYEFVPVRGEARQMTKVHLKGGRVVTFFGALTRAEAVFNVSYQRNIEKGMTEKQAKAIARKAS